MPERKALINLPIKLVLTEEGSTFFIRKGKNLRRFRLADGAEEYGIELDAFTPASLQRMLLVDYVAKVELSKAELMSSKPEVTDLCKLVVYSMLYRKFDSCIFGKLLARDVIKKWNRANPANPIDDKTKINDASLQEIMGQKADEILAVKEEILSPMAEYISKNPALIPEEKNVQLLLSEKFLNNLRPFTWFIIAKFLGTEDYAQLVKDIRTSLSEYMEKAKIAEYVSLAVMELAMNAETTSLKREVRTLFKGAVDGNAVLFDPSIRKQALLSLERRADLVALSWRIGSRGASVGTEGRLQIALYGRGALYGAAQDSAEARPAGDIQNTSIQDFYRQLPAGEVDTELALYYLAYLSEACERAQVKFDSRVSQAQDSDLAMMTLTLNL
jgi:hypothetical protein